MQKQKKARCDDFALSAFCFLHSAFPTLPRAGVAIRAILDAAAVPAAEVTLMKFVMSSRLATAVLVSLALLPLRTELRADDVAPPVIRSVTPDSGSVIGGTTVKIEGDNLDLPPGYACLLPCPPSVIFGDIAVSASFSYIDHGLITQSPSHVAGTVDVTVRTGDQRTATLPNAFTYRLSGEILKEQILLPIYLDQPLPGVAGSLWITDLWLRNDSDTQMGILPFNCREVICSPVFPSSYRLDPGETIHGLPPVVGIPAGTVGRLLYIDPDSSLSVGLRVADTSRATLDDGTELPVIRQEEMLTRTANLLGIGNSPNARTLLRIYETTSATTSFRIATYPFTSSSPLPGPTPFPPVTYVTVEQKQSDEFRSTPGYVQVDLTRLLPLDSSTPTRVEIVPLTPGSRFWTFVSITNNETQHVTLVTPQ